MIINKNYYNYIKGEIKAFLKFIATALVISLIISILVTLPFLYWYIDNNIIISSNVYRIFIITFVTIMIINIVYFLACIFKQRKCFKIMNELGICQKYIDEYIKINNTKSDYVKFTIGDLYLSLDLYAEAEKWLNNIDRNILVGTLKVNYLLDLAILMFDTNRIEEGKIILEQNNEFLNKYARQYERIFIRFNIIKAKEQRAFGDYENAIDILIAVKQKFDVSEFQEVIAVYVSLIYTYFRAEKYELMKNEKQLAYIALDSIEKMAFSWSKQYYREKIENASRGII